MQKISYEIVSLPEERDQLADWLAEQPWPFHVCTEMSRDQALGMIDRGHFRGPDQESYWIVDDQRKIGLVRLMDLNDIDEGNPMFDLRLVESMRGRGLGQFTVRWLTNLLFNRYTQLNRLAGNTRDDNRAMQKVFERCGYIKEGCFREAWPAASGRPYDSVYYGILRNEWRQQLEQL